MGKAIAEKADELLNTGKLEFLGKLKKEAPPSLADWLQGPGLGPKKIALIWQTLHITALAQLGKAARAGKFRHVPAWVRNQNSTSSGLYDVGEVGSAVATSLPPGIPAGGALHTDPAHAGPGQR